MAGYAGRGTLFEFGNGTTGTPDTVEGVSLSAGIATITMTGHAFAVGDVIEIVDVVGITAINDFHIVRTIDTDEINVERGTMSGSYTSGGTVTAQNTAWTSIPAVQSWSAGDVRQRIDVSALDTPGGRAEFASGLSEGDWSISANWLPNAAAHGIASGLALLAEQGTAFWSRVSFPQVSTNPSPKVAYLGLLLDSNYAVEEKMALELSGPINRALLLASGA